MYKITRDITLDVNDANKDSTQGVITIPQEIADTYRLAIHITKDRQPEDLSDYRVQMKFTKQDGTEVAYDSYQVSGNTVYYVVSPQLTAELGKVECQVEISKLGDPLYKPKFQCLITDAVGETETYVTPEMYGAVGDDKADDSDALQLAFYDGRDVVFLNNYYITKTINISGKSHLKVYGNHHTVRISSKEPTENDRDAKYAFHIDNCRDISVENLTIQSSADQDLIAIEQENPDVPRIYTSHFKASNIQGFKVQNTDNLSIQSYTSYNLSGDISLQSCNNVRIDSWYSNHSLMGLYTSMTKNVSISNFRIISDPENTVEYFHAFYLCYGTEDVSISNGEAIFENKHEKVLNVHYLGSDNTTDVIMRTPLLSIHADDKEERQKRIYVDNVKFTAQRIINIRRMIDTPVFSNCTFTTYYPDDVIISDDGQLTVYWNTVFNNCNFNLGDIGVGIESDIDDRTILLNNCQLCCSNRKNTGDPSFLLGFYGKFQLSYCSISWPYYVRKVTDSADTEFYNCAINLLSERPVVIISTQAATKTSIINSFIKGGCYVRYRFTPNGGVLNIIDSHLVSDNAVWYEGTLDTFPFFSKIYNSYHNDKKISITSGTADSDALATHMIDPYAHANIELDGNDFN